MRILFLINYYPPHEIGGQERSCLEVVEGLAQRGHICQVLTSMHGVDNQPVEEGVVRRWLYPEMDLARFRHSLVFFTQRKQREQQNLRRLEQCLSDFRPDVVFVWGMWNLPHSLPALAEQLLPGRVAYRFAEYWPALPTQHELYWRTLHRGRLSYLPKWILSRIALAILKREKRNVQLKFEHAMCVSQATRKELLDLGIPVSHARVIHTGLDFRTLEALAGDGRVPEAEGRLRLLFAGRLSVEKGVETAIWALDELRTMPDAPLESVRLSLAGSGKPAYERRLRELTSELELENVVSFLGRLPAEQMPALMARHDVLIVPSVWPEPFARVVLEGMAGGMAVLATPAGGTGEILVDGENGLLFPAEDSRKLAQLICTLLNDPVRRGRLAEAGRRTVEQGFTQRAMLDAIEEFLRQAAGRDA